MSFIDRSDTKVFYEVVGEASNKPPITLINGHTRSSGDFRGLSRYLATIGIQSILVDNRGAGRSVATTEFTLIDMEDDVIAIWDKLEIKKSSLLGISMGGFICQGISIRCPERVEKLVLVSTANSAKWIKPAGGGWIDDPDAIEAKLASYFAPGFVERNQLLFETMVKQTRASIIGETFIERSKMQKDAVSKVPYTRDLSAIMAPTLIIHGIEDQIIDIGAAKELAEKIPSAELKIMDHVGHLILAESPKLLYSMVADFILES